MTAGTSKNSKTYYKWERRALAAMVKALGNREPGRPSLPIDLEKESPRASDPGVAGEARSPGAEEADPSAVRAAGLKKA